jgi:glycosyltransferase 2 family protein
MLQSREIVTGGHDAGDTSNAHRGHHSYRWLALRAGLGVAAISLLLWRYNARSILGSMAMERPGYFGTAAGVYMAIQLVSAWRWRLLAVVLKLEASFVEFLWFRFIATFINTVAPGVLGGDAARAIYLGRRNNRFGEAFVSVVADRGVGFIGLVWLAAFAAVFLNRATLPAAVIATPVAASLIALAAIIASPIILRLARSVSPRISRYANAISACLHHPWTLLATLAISVALEIALAVCQYLLAKGIGLDAPLTMYLFCVPAAGVFASLPLTVNGLGVREGVYVALFGLYGVKRSNGVTLGLLWFITTTVGALPGLIALVAVRPVQSHTQE